MEEAIDGVAALVSLGVSDLVGADVLVSLGALVKTPDDRALIHQCVPRGSAA